MRGAMFFVIAVILAAVDLVVPFVLLSSTGSFLGAFLFWCVLTLAVIVWAGLHTRTWGRTK